MQTLKILGTAAAFSLLASGAALAQSAAFHAEAKLATPVSAPAEATISGVKWTCTADSCVGAADRYASLDNPVKECRKVAAELGPFVAYSSRGRVMSAGNVKACNTAVAAKAGGAVTAQK